MDELRQHPNVKVRLLAEALQNMEEIGGPEQAEYIEVMSKIKAEIELCIMRALVLQMTGN